MSFVAKHITILGIPSKFAVFGCCALSVALCLLFIVGEIATVLPAPYREPEWEIPLLAFGAGATVFVWLAVWVVRKARRQAERLSSGLCPSCGYDLRATPNRCPECGAVRDAFTS
jgi:cyanate permease